MPPYLSANQLAERYSVDPSTIWRWVKKGHLPKPKHLGERTTRFDLEEVEAHEEVKEVAK